MWVAGNLAEILRLHPSSALEVLVLESEVASCPYFPLEPTEVDFGTKVAGLVEEVQNYCLVPSGYLEVVASFNQTRRH